jgi:hypothetical protein
MKRFMHSAFLIASLTTGSLAAAQVSYTVADVSGSTWEYNYSILNNTAVTSIGEFTVYYTLGEYSNLKLESSPKNWSSIVAQPDASLPADGFFDAQALDGGLTHGNTATGFSVEFTYLGKGTPPAQAFDIVDPNTFATLTSGETSGKSIAAPEIDLGSSAGCIALLFGTLAVMRGRQSSKARS